MNIERIVLTLQSIAEFADYYNEFVDDFEIMEQISLYIIEESWEVG